MPSRWRLRWASASGFVVDRIELRGDEDLVARHAAVAQGAADARLVAVGLRGVDVAVAELERPANGVLALGAVGGICQTPRPRGGISLPSARARVSPAMAGEDRSAHRDLRAQRRAPARAGSRSPARRPARPRDRPGPRGRCRPRSRRRRRCRRHRPRASAGRRRRRCAPIAATASACLTALVSASETKKYTLASTGAGRRSSRVRGDRDGNRRARRQRVDRRTEAAVGEDARMDAGREVAQLGDALLRLVHRGRPQAGGRLGLGLGLALGQAQRGGRRSRTAAARRRADRAWSRARAASAASMIRRRAARSSAARASATSRSRRARSASRCSSMSMNAVTGSKAAGEVERRRRVRDAHDRAVLAHQPALVVLPGLAGPPGMRDGAVLLRERRAVGVLVVDRLVAGPADELRRIVIAERRDRRGVKVALEAALVVDHPDRLRHAGEDRVARSRRLCSASRCAVMSMNVMTTPRPVGRSIGTAV